MRFEQRDLNVCTDCMMYIAYDEFGEHLDDKDKDMIVKSVDQFDELTIACEIEPFFSWQPCECCGCRLGGDRHLAIELFEVAS
jgi:hypothetical protein